MPKRRKDASTRRFFDEFERVKVSRLRANGTIDPAKRQALIPFPDGTTRLLGVGHTHFPCGGGFSFFICPKCARLSRTLYTVDGAPTCRRCCEAMNIVQRSRYGFGRADRRRASDKLLDQLIAKVETTEPLTLKPAHPALRGKRRLAKRTQRLTQSMLRKRIALRLGQLASRQAPNDDGRLTITRAFTPTKDALAIIPDLAKLWKANSTERLQQALDKAQSHIINALQSDDQAKRNAAARLMMRTKQARDIGII
jgi:hypothetical protein